MIHSLKDFNLRPIEPKDIDALYVMKNAPEIASLLGGFSAGYSMADIRDWIDNHRKRNDEIIWAISRSTNDDCVGHVGLYKIDHRVRSCEYAILIGVQALWGEGLGTKCTRYAINYAFSELNLNRISLSLLKENIRALALYRKLGFNEEGLLRQAQFKNGRYLDVILMSLLKSEYNYEHA